MECLSATVTGRLPRNAVNTSTEQVYVCIITTFGACLFNVDKCGLSIHAATNAKVGKQ